MKRLKLLHLAAYLYLFIPVALFFVGWVRLEITIPLMAAAAYCLFRALRRLPSDDAPGLFANKKMLIICVAVLVCWVWFSGIGGLAWQNRWDHMFRNAVFRDLCFNEWPVIKADEGVNLCYYFGFWLPPALVGKLTGSLSAGYLAQLAWGTIGVVLGFLLISQWLGKLSYTVLAVFIFFSGLDLFPFLRNHLDDPSGILRHLAVGGGIDGETYVFQNSSNTTLLFWVYNQIIPFWVGFMLLLLAKEKKSLFFTFSLLILCSPFPAFALIPVIIYWTLSRAKPASDDSCAPPKEYLAGILTVENFVALGIALVTAFFFMSNIATNTVELHSPTGRLFFHLACFLVLEYIVYVLFVGTTVFKDRLLQILLVTTMVCCFIMVGGRVDFGMRTCIPLSFYLMLLVLREFTRKEGFPGLRRKLLAVVLFIGAATPVLEFWRTAQAMAQIEFLGRRESYLSGGLTSVFDKEFMNKNSKLEKNGCYNNFVGREDSFFCKYLRNKKPQKQ